MTTIGGKTKQKKPAQPQIVIQRSHFANEFALMGFDERNEMSLRWVGDPNAATKFDSKYAAKVRARDFSGITIDRLFKTI